MLYRILALGGLISLAACNGTHEPSTPSPTVNPGLQGSRPVEFVATLTEFTQRPTPTGLPTRFQVTSVRMPAPGEKLDITWRALDGSSQTAPMTGTGLFERADAQKITVTLRATSGGDQPALVLEGTLEGTQARGTFADRLFYTRSGAFLAEIRQQ
jgi:hypothetical protein